MDIAANINAQLRVSKRTYADDIDFRIVVAPIGTFQTLVGTVHSLLNDVHFFVIKTKDFEGIKVEGQGGLGDLDSRQVFVPSPQKKRRDR